jgi:hypothetical protein
VTGPQRGAREARRSADVERRTRWTTDIDLCGARERTSRAGPRGQDVVGDGTKTESTGSAHLAVDAAERQTTMASSTPASRIEALVGDPLGSGFTHREVGTWTASPHRREVTR